MFNHFIRQVRLNDKKYQKLSTFQKIENCKKNVSELKLYELRN